MAVALSIPLNGEILSPLDLADSVPYPERKVDARRELPDEEGLTVGDVTRLFEEAEEASYEARKAAERDRDFHDNKQLTEEEVADLKKRGQPEVIINRIKRKVDFLVGLEKQQRTMPRAMPRTPVHEQDAQAVTDALRYVAQSENFQAIRSAVWRNMLIEGAGAACVSVTPKGPSPASGGNQIAPYGMVGPSFDVKLRWYAWDRFFADPHSGRPDYEDASYLGTVLWWDRADAVDHYGPNYVDAIDATIETGHLSDTYGDRPDWLVWSDRKRKRLRIVQMWIKRRGEWYFCEFTKGGFLKTGPSPYHDEDGRTCCEIVARSAYVDRNNNRFGTVREMISPQEEINKRRSKALHILNTKQVIAEEGAVSNEETARQEAAKPDGWITLNPGGKERFEFHTQTEMAAGQLQLLQEAKAEIDMMGPTAAMSGQASPDTSGKAIMASQQGGMVQLGDLLDGLREWDKQIFRQIWYRIREFWDAPMWVRVTDDERNVRFTGVNGATNPQTGQPGPMLAELDVDIILDDAPDGIAPALEQFQALVELKKWDTQGELSFRTIVQAMPNLKDKDALLSQMDQAQAAAAQAAQANGGMTPELMAAQQQAQAEMELERQRSEHTLVIEKQKADAEADRKLQQAALDARLAEEKMQLTAKLETFKANMAAEIARIKALADIECRAARNGHDMSLKEHQAMMDGEAAASEEPEEPKEVPQDALASALDRLASAFAAPVKIIRGKDGLVQGAVKVMPGQET